MRNKIVFLSVFIVLSCSSTNTFKHDKALFEGSKVLLTFKSVGDLNDSYFIVKENNFFEFYKVLYDSVKNSSYPGKFTMNGDTMLLQFYNDKGQALLGKKALIENNKKEIVFFDNFPGYKKRLLVN